MAWRTVARVGIWSERRDSNPPHKTRILLIINVFRFLPIPTIHKYAHRFRAKMCAIWRK